MIDLSNLFKEQVQRRRAVNDYLSTHVLPVAIVRATKMHVKDYHDVHKERKKEAYVLSLLPHHMQVELLFETRKPFMIMHPLFQSLVIDFSPAARQLSQQAFKPVFA